MIFELIIFLLVVRPIIRFLTRLLFGFGYGRPPMMGPHFHHGPHMHMHHPHHMHHHMHGPRF